MPVKRRKTTKRRNPRGKHLAGATAAMNRQYEAILRSERKRGVPLKEAKRIAAATVRARAKATNPKRRRNKAAHISESDISKFPPNIQAQLRKQLGKVEEKKAKASTPKQKAAAAKAHRSFLSRLGTRLRVIGQTKTRKVQARDLSR